MESFTSSLGNCPSWYGEIRSGYFFMPRVWAVRQECTAATVTAPLFLAAFHSERPKEVLVTGAASHGEREIHLAKIALLVIFLRRFRPYMPPPLTAVRYIRTRCSFCCQVYEKRQVADAEPLDTGGGGEGGIFIRCLPQSIDH